MRFLALLAFSGLTLFGLAPGEPAHAQQPARPIAPPLNPCKTARTASARLICADRDLYALDSILAMAYRDAKSASSLSNQALLAKEQQAWMNERNAKCGLIGKDLAPLAELRKARQCVEDAIETRIAHLQDATPVKPAKTVSATAAEPGLSPAASSAPGPDNRASTKPDAAAPAADQRQVLAAGQSQPIATAAAASSQPPQTTAQSQPVETALDNKQNIKHVLPPVKDALPAIADQRQLPSASQSQPVATSPAAASGMVSEAAQSPPVTTVIDNRQRIKDIAVAAPATPSIEPQRDANSGGVGLSAAATSSYVSITPVFDPGVSPPGGEPTGSRFSTFHELRFSAPNGTAGTIDCGAQVAAAGSDALARTPLAGKPIIKIAVDDDENSYRLFQNDGWTPFLDNLRNAVRSACATAMQSGRLRTAANEPVSELHTLFAVYSPQGLFMAYSTGQSAPWTVATNLPKARRKVRLDLGIQRWIEPTQLARNPYFFLGSVVGMVIQFDRMASDNAAVFARTGAEIYVNGVPPTLFQNQELVVLAGRVTGNKGVITPSGSEVLMPALDYVGAQPCGESCGGF